MQNPSCAEFNRRGTEMRSLMRGPTGRTGPLILPLWGQIIYHEARYGNFEEAC